MRYINLCFTYLLTYLTASSANSPVRDLTSPRVGNLRVGASACCPVSLKATDSGIDSGLQCAQPTHTTSAPVGHLYLPLPRSPSHLASRRELAIRPLRCSTSRRSCKTPFDSSPCHRRRVHADRSDRPTITRSRAMSPGAAAAAARPRAPIRSAPMRRRTLVLIRSYYSSVRGPLRRRRSSRRRCRLPIPSRRRLQRPP